MSMVKIKLDLVVWLLLLVFLKINFETKLPLTVVKPGTQTRRFTHVSDTIDVCFKAWKMNKCKYYSISHKKSYSILPSCQDV